MKLRIFLNLFVLAIFCPNIYCQDSIHPIYSLVISKYTNNENDVTSKVFEVDSSGQIYLGQKKTKKKFDINKFNKEITRYVLEEKIKIYPGNDNIIVIQAPWPKLNKQHVIVSIKFLDDFYKERELRNKTYYSWGKPFDIEVKDYPLFKYLTETEIKVIKAFLE